VAVDVPGLYFVGLHFLTAMSSAMVHGVGRDAARIAGLVRDAIIRPATADADGPLREKSEGVRRVGRLKASA
jgi:hypothetical protein